MLALVFTECQETRVHQVSVQEVQVFYQGKYYRKRPPEVKRSAVAREVPMVEVHPTPIVGILEQLGHTLQLLAQREVDAPLAVLEMGVLEAVRAVQAELLGAVLRLSQRSLWPSGATRQWPCPHCGDRHGAQSWRPRTVATVCGQLSFERPWCVCVVGGSGFSPTDQALGLVGQTRLSAVLVEWVVEGGARTSFAEAAALLQRWTGLVVSSETVRQRTEASGAGWRRPMKRRPSRCKRRGRPLPRWTPRQGSWWSRRMGRWCTIGMPGMR